MMTNEDKGARRARDVAAKVLGAFLMIAGTVLVTAPALSAADAGCGEYSFDFSGTRLINDGISTSAGPFAIGLPAGTYDITLVSDDNHPYPTYQTEQTQEQWFFMLDNGYVSPPTQDVPSDSQKIVTSFSAVEIAEAKTVTVQHLGEGGVNSVNVSCIGFTTSEVEVAAPATTTTEAPAIAAPTATTEAPEIAAPTTEAPSVEAVTTTTGVAVAPASTIETAVQGVVETPVQQLAVTGRDTNIALLAGVLMIMMGMGLVTVASRPSVR